jgi:N,N'-diacetylchitobiose transport system permease protein
MAVQSEPVRAKAPGPGAGGDLPKRPGPSRGRSLLRGGTPYLLLLPAVAATLVLLVWPLIEMVVISLQNMNRRQLIQHLTEWNGFDNYTNQLTSGEFWHTVGRSVAFTAVNVLLTMVGGTLVGLLLNRLGRKMRLLLSLGLVLAWAMPLVASTTVYTWLFDARYGVVNWFLDHLGRHGMATYDWYSSQLSTFFVITLLIVWGSIPFVAFNMYAALTTIPKELYEAARMDGAGAVKIFNHVIFPNLRPFFLATTFLEVIWIFKCFTQVFTINQGGPERLTETMPVYAYVEGFGNQHFGAGAAIAVLTILILGVLTAYYFRITLKQEDEL